MTTPNAASHRVGASLRVDSAGRFTIEKDGASVTLTKPEQITLALADATRASRELH